MPDTRAPRAGARSAAWTSRLPRRAERPDRARSRVARSRSATRSSSERRRPIAGPERIRRAVFRHEILPLLQEYAYEDYGELAQFVGDEIIDVGAQQIRTTVVDDHEELLRALEAAFARQAE